MKLRNVVIAGALLGIGYAVYNGSMKLLNKIKWGFKGIDIDGIGLSDGISLNIGVKLSIDNQSDLTIPIEKFEGKVLYKGSELCPVKSAAYTEIKPNQISGLRYIVPLRKETITTIFGNNWLDAYKNFKDSIRPSNYVLQGEVSFRLGNVLHIYTLNEPFVIS